jgi:hypothetical protein
VRSTERTTEADDGHVIRKCRLEAETTAFFASRKSVGDSNCRVTVTVGCNVTTSFELELPQGDSNVTVYPYTGTGLLSERLFRVGDPSSLCNQRKCRRAVRGWLRSSIYVPTKQSGRRSSPTAL